MLFLLGDDGDLRVLAPAWGGLGGLLAADRSGAGDQVGMVHDPVGDRLVLWIGATRQTWIFHGDRWDRLRCRAAPPAGFPRLCATDSGVYCLAGGGLWLLAGDRWAPVGRDPEWAGRLLFARPGRPGLWSINERQVGVWRDGQFHAVAGLPPGIIPPGDPAPVDGTDDRDLILSAVYYDPVGDRLVASGAGGVWQTRMEALEAPETELPPPGLSERDGIDAEYAVEEPEAGSFSTFLFEYSVSPGGARRADVVAYPDLSRIADATAEVVNVQDPMLNTVLDGWTLHLWVVQRGVLTQGIDLRPYVIARFGDGAQIDLGPDRHEVLRELVARRQYPVGFTVDRAALAATVPALQQPLLAPDGLIVLRFDGPRPDPGTFSYLDHGERFHFGYQDLEGNLTAEEQREVNEGIDYPSGLDDDVRELDSDELRELGWRL